MTDNGNEKWTEQVHNANMPGYGFAKVPVAVKKQWQSLIVRYCETRSSLRLIVLVMDIRHPLQPADREWLELLGGGTVMLAIILNKADCLGRMQQKKAHVKVFMFG